MSLVSPHRVNIDVQFVGLRRGEGEKKKKAFFLRDGQAVMSHSCMAEWLRWLFLDWTIYKNQSCSFPLFKRHIARKVFSQQALFTSVNTVWAPLHWYAEYAPHKSYFHQTMVKVTTSYCAVAFPEAMKGTAGAFSRLKHIHQGSLQVHGQHL